MTSRQLVVVNATTVTVDARNSVIADSTIVSDDGVLTYIGPRGGAPARAADAILVDACGGIAMPGMVNAHAHLAMTMFRGFADDLDLDGFLGKLLPVEGRVLSDDTVLLGSQLAVAECLRSGITSVLDMYFFPDPTRHAASAAGLRVLNGPVFIEFPGPDNRPFTERLAWARDVLIENPGAWLQPHSSYLLDADQLRAIGELAAEFDAPINVHSSETAAEMQQVAARHGTTPTRILADTGLLTARTVCAHGVHVTNADIDLLAAAGASVAHCPASNLKLASGIARVPELQRGGVNVALGTDGSASANDLDLFMAMRLAGYMQKGSRGDAAILPAAALVRMATIDGARALGIDHLVGSLEVGKRSDLLVLDVDAPSMHPVFDPHAAIAYAATRAEVRTVVTDGRVVVEHGRVTSVDLGAVLTQIDALATQFGAP
jgi:5-methylthioadenosine/S-adenosylhomocysteine deaminase